MKEIRKINDQELDTILETNEAPEDIYYDRNKIMINGQMFYRESIVNDEKPTTKSTAASLIRKEPEFNFKNIIDEVYMILEEHKIDGLYYANTERQAFPTAYQIDLHAAYPHIFKYERLPISSHLYKEEGTEHMNFYAYWGKLFRYGSIITDDMKKYVEEREGSDVVEYLFSTDYKVGSKMGDWLIEKAYKNKKTKQEIKSIHYGFYQKKYLQYDKLEDCYIKDERNVYELIMIAVISQLTYIMLNIKDLLNQSCYFVVDAVHFNELPDLDMLRSEMTIRFSNYDWRIAEDVGRVAGKVVYQTYPDLPEAPRSHHKKCTKEEQ